MRLAALKAELGSDAPPVYALEPEGDCSEFLDALRALVKANSSEEEAALRHL
jgi:hypothetical protein